MVSRAGVGGRDRRSLADAWDRERFWSGNRMVMLGQEKSTMRNQNPHQKC
jgi:hypothetical protein